MTPINSKDLVEVLKTLDSMKSLALRSSNFPAFKDKLNYVHLLVPLSNQLIDQSQRLPDYEQSDFDDVFDTYKLFITSIRQYVLSQQ